MPVLELNGVELHTQVLGNEGPLLFMAHGLVSGSIATWYFQFAPSLAKKYRVVLYDMRGHGKSEKASHGYDLRTMAQDLHALIQYYQTLFDVKDEAVHLSGHSYGALVVLHYALYHGVFGGAKVGSMAIVDAPLPASHFIYPGMRDVATQTNVDDLAEHLMTELGLTSARRRAQFVQHLSRLYLNSSLKQDISKSGDVDDEQLASLNIPTLLVYGKASDCHHIGQRLANLLPNNTFESVDCGHYVTMERPKELSASLNKFFGV